MPKRLEWSLFFPVFVFGCGTEAAHESCGNGIIEPSFWGNAMLDKRRCCAILIVPMLRVGTVIGILLPVKKVMMEMFLRQTSPETLFVSGAF